MGAFDQSGNILWTVPNYNPIMATADGGVVINDSQRGIIQLDSNGNALQTIAGLVAPDLFYLTTNPPLTPSWSGQWYGISASSSGISNYEMPFVAPADNVWAEPGGNPSQIGFAAALCSCLLQSDDASSDQALSSPVASQATPAIQTSAEAPTTTPANSTNCPICTLPQPEPATCMTFAGSGPTFLILIGDSGINTTNGRHNQGPLFKEAAQTQANFLSSAGDNVIACRVSSVEDFGNALLGKLSGGTFNGLIDGGVIYFGHGARYPGTDNNGKIFYYSIVAPGEQAGTDTNISYQNVMSLSNTRLGSGATFTIVLNGCLMGGETPSGSPPIARLIANWLQRTVTAYEGGTHFSNLEGDNDRTEYGVGKPSGLPMYLNPDGVPPRPQPTYFYSSH